MTAFRASLSNLMALLPQSHDCNCYVSRRTLAPPPLWLQRQIEWYTLNLPTCGISLGTLMLPALEAGDFFGITPTRCNLIWRNTKQVTFPWGKSTGFRHVTLCTTSRNLTWKYNPIGKCSIRATPDIQCYPNTTMDC